jgi:hypothetical protein
VASPANDGYEAYYAEKLWELVPPYHRHEDGIAARPDVLRALFELFAAQAAVVRRSNDRLWDDAFIELSDDWAVPYLGELVGTRLVSALNPRGRRVDVAKTIYYRRRKGTLRVLEELIADITGWEGTVIENFRRLGRHRHGLDPQPTPLAGRFTATSPGGWADLRCPFGSTLADGPFDEYAHTADMRRQRGQDGRFGIPKIAVHLFRLRAFRLTGVTPFSRVGGATFTFDPAGRDIALFMPRQRGSYDEWRAAQPWELPAPIRCRLLGHAEYVIGETLIQALASAGMAAAAVAELGRLRGVHFRDEARLRAQIDRLSNKATILAFIDQILRGALVAECGKGKLLPTAVEVDAPGGAVPAEQIVAGNLSDWSAAPPGKALVIDPEHGRFKLLGGPPAGALSVTYHYGFSGTIGAGAYDRRDDLVAAPAASLVGGGGAIATADIPLSGSLEIPDSATYSPVASRFGIGDLVVQGANFQRPYLGLNADWVLTAAGANATLTLDGLWIGGHGAHAVELAGDWATVTIRHTTFDPGGADVDGNPIGPITLRVVGTIDTLIVERSICGPIVVTAGGTLDTLRVADSIVQAREPGVKAIEVTRGELHLARVTTFGEIDVERLYADAAICTAPVDVTDTQHGCFRFSTAPPGSRLPRPFESFELANGQSLFTSRRFGDPGYAQLSQAAPLEVARGAESGSEMGAFSSLNAPIKADSLARKIDEFLPFGLIPIFLPAT